MNFTIKENIIYSSIKLYGVDVIFLILLYAGYNNIWFDLTYSLSIIYIVLIIPRTLNLLTRISNHISYVYFERKKEKTVSYGVNEKK